MASRLSQMQPQLRHQAFCRCSRQDRSDAYSFFLGSSHEFPAYQPQMAIRRLDRNAIDEGRLNHNRLRQTFPILSLISHGDVP